MVLCALHINHTPARDAYNRGCSACMYVSCLLHLYQAAAVSDALSHLESMRWPSVAFALLCYVTPWGAAPTCSCSQQWQKHSIVPSPTATAALHVHVENNRAPHDATSPLINYDGQQHSPVAAVDGKGHAEPPTIPHAGNASRIMMNLLLRSCITS